MYLHTHTFHVHTKYWKVSDAGTLTRYLGVHVTRDANGGWTVDNSPYITQPKEKFDHYPLPTSPLIPMPTDWHVMPSSLHLLQLSAGYADVSRRCSPVVKRCSPMALMVMLTSASASQGMQSAISDTHCETAGLCQQTCVSRRLLRFRP